jgi:hypothetical protein
MHFLKTFLVRSSRQLSTRIYYIIDVTYTIPSLDSRNGRMAWVECRSRDVAYVGFFKYLTCVLAEFDCWWESERAVEKV